MTKLSFRFKHMHSLHLTHVFPHEVTIKLRYERLRVKSFQYVEMFFNINFLGVSVYHLLNQEVGETWPRHLSL